MSKFEVKATVKATVSATVEAADKSDALVKFKAALQSQQVKIHGLVPIGNLRSAVVISLQEQKRSIRRVAEALRSKKNKE